MFDSGIICNRDRRGFHFVVTNDEAGIKDFSSLIRELIAGSGSVFLSLFFTGSEKKLHPLFKKELSILEKRYSDELLVLSFKSDSIKNSFKQELIEAYINSNTLPKMRFSVIGNSHFAKDVSGVIQFPDMKAYMLNANTKSIPNAHTLRPWQVN